MYSWGMTSITEMTSQMKAQAEAEVRHQLRLAVTATGADAVLAHTRAVVAFDEVLSMYRAEADLMGEVIEGLARKLVDIERVAAAVLGVEA